MGGGIHGEFFDLLLGPGAPKPSPSGAFGDPQALYGLGSNYSRYLASLLKEDVTKTQPYSTLTTSLRDTLGAEVGRAKASFGDAAVAGGFADSGAVPAAYGDIARSGLSAYSSGLRDIYLGLEKNRMDQINNILPFLSGASQESVALQQLLSGNMLSNRAENQLITKQISEEARSWYGMFAGKGMTQ